jgi:hypothetical protein
MNEPSLRLGLIKNHSSYFSSLKSVLVLGSAPLDNLPLLQDITSEVSIYPEDIIGPPSSLKYLSTLVILQSLLNL